MKRKKVLPKGSIVGKIDEPVSEIVLRKLQRTSRPFVTLALVIGVISLLVIFRGPLARLVGFNTTCSGDKKLIELYNTTVKNDGVTQLGPVVKKVHEKKFSSDATCMYMLMISQYGDVRNNDEEATYRALVQLESQGKKVSEKINDGIDRSVVEQTIQRRIDDRNKGYYGEG